MKKLWNILGVICYPLLYLGIQLVVTSVAMIPLVVKITVDALQSGTNPDTAGLTSAILKSTDFNLITGICALLTLVIIWLILRGKGSIREVYSLNKISAATLCLAVVFGAAFNVFLSLVMGVTHIADYFPEYMELMSQIVGKNNVFIEIISVAILAPLAEEVIFRGIVLKRLTKMVPVPVAVIISSALFGLIHGNILQGSYAFVLAVLIGTVFVWTRSL